MKQFVLLILTILIISCNNKKDDPQPISNSNGTPPPITTNTPPTVSATPSSATNPTTITVNATDADGTISKVEIFNGSTLLTTLTTSPYIYTLPTLTNGSYTYTVKATDNSNTVSSTTVSFTVSTTPTPKDVTITLLSGFYGDVNGVEVNGITTISAISFKTTATQNNDFLRNASAGTYSYTVLDNGNVKIIVSSSLSIEYIVQVASGNLVLTEIADASKIYQFYK